MNHTPPTDPTTVFQALFSAIELPALQEHLWIGLKAMVSGRYAHLPAKEKEMQLEIYELLQQAIVAMHRAATEEAIQRQSVQ